MGTFVLLAAFLLAVSATPIEHPSGPSFEDTAGTDAENSPSSLPVDVSGTGAQHNSHDTHTDGASGNGDQHEPSSPSSPDDASASEPASPQDAPQSSGEHETTEVDNNDDGQDNNGDASVSTVSDSTEGSSVGETTSTPVSSTSEGPTSPTTQSGADVTNETGVSVPGSSNGTVTLPPDADPTDCRNGSQPNHIFTLCEFGCEGDEMEVAPPNATCYLPLNNTDTLIAMARTAGDKRKTGRCVEGKCVEVTTDAWTAPQSNTSNSAW